MTRLMSISISALAGVLLAIGALLLPRSPALPEDKAMPFPALRRFVVKTASSAISRVPTRKQLIAGLEKIHRSFIVSLRNRGGDAETHVAAGWRAIGCGSLQRAEMCFRRATALDPSNTDALEGMAIVLAETGRREEAIPVYEKLIELGSEKREVRFDLAVACMEARRLAEAEQLFTELLDEDENDIMSRYNLAVIYHATGRLSEARDAWREVVRRRGDFINAREKLAESLLDLGDAEAAMEEYLYVADHRRDDADAWRNLAAAAEAAGSLGRAVVALQKAMQLSPDNAEIHADMGDLKLRIHRETGEKKFLAEAVAQWRESLKLNKNQPEIRKKLETYEKIISDERQ